MRDVVLGLPQACGEGLIALPAGRATAEQGVGCAQGWAGGLNASPSLPCTIWGSWAGRWTCLGLSLPICK